MGTRWESVPGRGIACAKVLRQERSGCVRGAGSRPGWPDYGELWSERWTGTRRMQYTGKEFGCHFFFISSVVTCPTWPVSSLTCQQSCIEKEKHGSAQPTAAAIRTLSFQALKSQTAKATLVTTARRDRKKIER